MRMLAVNDRFAVGGFSGSNRLGWPGGAISGSRLSIDLNWIRPQPVLRSAVSIIIEVT